MKIQEQHPEINNQILWFGTLGARIKYNAGKLTVAKAVIPSGVEGEIIRDIYGREKEQLDRQQGETQRIVCSPDTSFKEYFDVRDLAKCANAELATRYEEAELPYTDFSYFYKPEGLAPIAFIQRVFQNVR